MQTTKLKKKGFTLVELVIVVAVIAVLSAILVPTIGCVVEDAKETNDAATVRLLNAALVEDQAENGQPELFRDALAAMERKGYNIEKLTPRSSGDILWDSVNNRFALYKDGNPVYLDNSTAEPKKINLWKIVETEDENGNPINITLDEEYSHYLKGENYVADQLTVKTGLDVGNNTGITAIEYKPESTTAQSVVIRTNGGKLTILDTNNDSAQKHYGKAEYIDVSTGTSCYHEFGDVDVLIAKAGKVYAESGSSISIVAKEENATIEKNESSVIGIDLGTNLSNALTVVAKVGNNAYNSIDEAISAANAGDTVQLLKDITADSTININKALTIDGNRHKLTTTVTNTQIMNISGSGAFTLKNLTVYAQYQIENINNAIALNTSGKVIVEGCTFDGINQAYYNVLEYGGNVAVADGTLFSNNTFNGFSIRHNCINLYTETEGSIIYITGNSFNNLGTSSTNAIRISNYTDATVTFEIKDNNYSYVKQANKTIYAGFVLIQKNAGDIGKITLHFKNLVVMGKVATSNNQGTHDQVYYIYTDQTGLCTYDGLKAVTFEK